MAKVWTVLVIFVVAINLHHVKTEQSILEKGKLAVLGAISKVKEIADRGVSVQAERQQSYDIFGMKFGTNNGIETGFGDAVTEKNHESIEDDLYRRRRRKRSLDVLDALRAAGLFNANSAAGTNVNIVKINSVSNVNNYGPTTTPEVATESAKRRRRLIGGNRSPVVYEEVEQKVSYASSDLQMDKDGKFTSHTEEETGSKHMVQVEENEVDGPIVRNRRSLQVDDKGKLDDLVQDDTDKIFGPSRAKRGLVLSKLESKVSYFKSDSEAKPDGSMRTRTFGASQESKLTKIAGEPSSKGKHRAKRSPQEMDTDEMTTELPFTNGTGGPPRGPPGGKGGRGGGRGRGRGGGGEGGPRGKGKGRRPPPPQSSEDDDEESLDDLRQKREAGNESDSSYYSDSSSSEEGAQRKKREINAKADDENGAGGDSSDVSDSSFYSGSMSSESNESSSEEDNGSDPNAGGEETQDDEGDQKDESQRVRRSPCRGGSGGGSGATTLPSAQNRMQRSRSTVPSMPSGSGSISTTLNPTQRMKREIESQSEEDGGEGGGNVERDLSFFTDVMEKFFKAVKKVADKAKQVFSGGSRDGEGSHPDAERI